MSELLINFLVRIAYKDGLPQKYFTIVRPIVLPLTVDKNQ